MRHTIEAKDTIPADCPDPLAIIRAAITDVRDCALAMCRENRSWGFLVGPAVIREPGAADFVVRCILDTEQGTRPLPEGDG